MSRPGGSLRVALAWGLLWALLGGLALYLIAPNPWQIQGSRAIEMKAALSVLEHGGPALLGYMPGTHTPYAIGYSDDQGIYVIVPQLSYWLGQTNPTAVLRWLWVLAWMSTLALSAVVFRSLFESRWAWLLAPPTLLVCIASFGFGDIYWVSAWVLVTFLPLVILLARKRAPHQWLALVLIALVAGVVTSVRSEAGLPIALAAAAIAAASGRWPLRVVVLALIAFAYLAPTSIVMPAIREHRDHRIGVDLSAEEPTSHPLWHSLYIGLGYTSNRFGIHYLDAYGGAAAQESDPGVRFLSPAYSTALRKQVDALVTHDPGFVAEEEGEKIFVELFLAVPYLLLLAFLLPGAVAARGPACLRAFELALFAPALAIGALSPILAIPIRSYEQTLLAALGAVGLLAIGSAAARAQERWPAAGAAGAADGFTTERSRLSLERLWEVLPRRSTLRALLVTIVILVPASVFARHLEAAHARWDQSERSPVRVVLAAAPAAAAAPERLMRNQHQRLIATSSEA